MGGRSGGELHRKLDYLTHAAACFAFGGLVEALAELAVLNVGLFSWSKGLGDSAHYALATEYFDGFATASVFSVNFANNCGGVRFSR